ncbi:hypothetical protein TPAU25S_01721 [Tsukamurella paurometabola]
MVEIVPDADNHAAGSDGAATGDRTSAVVAEVGGAEGDVRAGLCLHPPGQMVHRGARIDSQIREEGRATDDVGCVPGKLRPGLCGGSQPHIVRAGRGQFFEDGEFGAVPGHRQTARCAGAEVRSCVEVEPSLASQMRQLGELARLAGHACVAEVADRGADGAFVAFEHGHPEATLERLDGVGQSHDAGPDDDDVRCAVHSLDRGLCADLSQGVSPDVYTSCSRVHPGNRRVHEVFTRDPPGFDPHL